MRKIKEEYLLRQSQFKELSGVANSIRLDLSLKHNPYINSGRITGKVKDETGKPVVNANVVIFNENYEIIANTLTENNGVYTIPTLEAGTKYFAYAKAPGYKLSEPGILAVKALETLEMDFCLQNDSDEASAVIIGTVQNFDNLPVATASIELYKKEDNYQIPITLTFSNEIGQFILSKLNIDSYLLKINAQGYFSEYYPVEIRQMNEIIPVTITLKKDLKASKGIIAGVITDDQAQPISDADVVLFRTGQNDEKIPVAYTRTNKEGVYMFVNVPPGSYCINSNRTVII